MLKKLLSLVAILCIIACASADCGAAWTKSVAPSATSFKFVNSLTSYDVKTVYVSSTSSNVEVSVNVCTDDQAQKDALKFDLSSTSSAVTLTASTTYSGSTSSTTGGPDASKNPINSATKTTAPFTTLLAIAFGLLVVFRPNNKLSVVAILVVLGLVLVSHAASTVTITVTIAIPDSITTVCDGSNCGGRDASPITSYVTVYGDRYATLDTLYGGSCDVSKTMELPSNWKLATSADATALLAIAFHDWTADGLVLADGSVYANKKYNSKSSTGGLKTVSGGYQVAACNTKILIAQHFPISSSKAVVISSISISNFVSLNGYDYAVADNAAYNSTTAGAQSGGVYFDSTSGWEIAPEDDNTFVFAKSAGNIFGCECVVMKTGNAYSSSTLSACGSGSQLVSATYGSGSVVGVGASGNYRVLVRREHTGAVNSLPTTMSISNTHVQGTLEYAVLDNTDPYDITLAGCQSRFLAIPSGWRAVTASELYTFLLNNKPATGNVWVNANCFVNSDVTYDRDVQACNSKLVTKTVDSVSYYGVQGCGKILIARSFAKKTDLTIGMKVLLISEGTTNATIDVAILSLAKTVFAATGIPYDWVPLANADGSRIYPGSLPLYDTDGTPKYYAIVMTSVQPLIKLGSSNVAALTPEQRTQLQAYRFQNSVRMVTLNDFKTDNTQGVTSATPASGVAATGACVRLDNSFVSSYSQYLSGVVGTAAFDVTGQFYNSVVLPANGVAVLRLIASATADPSTGAIVAAIITNSDNTQELQFYTGSAEYLDHGPVLANMWLSWVTRNMWAGARRVYFSPQVDDLFLSTGQYGNEVREVRMTGADMRTTKTFVQNLNTKAPAGSKVTLAFGANCAEAKATGDDLVLATQECVNDFFWESHTWSHLDLDCNPEDDPNCHDTTYDETMAELAKNNNWTATYLFPTLGLDTPTWSRHAMITPAITGLFNGEALHALYDIGEICVVGDNSRPELVPANPYLGMWTTKEINNFAGIFIIPRYPTEIYFNAADEGVLLHEYNDRYAPGGSHAFFPRNSTLAEILVREGENNFRHLAVFRHDPYMFHQCNLHHFNYAYNGGASQSWNLMELWLETVVDRYISMLNFPLLGVKQQDLYDVYMARREREFCGIDAKLTIAAGAAASVKVSSTGSCEAAITGLSSCTGVSNCRTETYALDHTVWAKVAPGSGATLPASGAWA